MANDPAKEEKQAPMTAGERLAAELSERGIELRIGAGLPVDVGAPVEDLKLADRIGDVADDLADLRDLVGGGEKEPHRRSPQSL